MIVTARAQAINQVSVEAYICLCISVVKTGIAIRTIDAVGKHYRRLLRRASARTKFRCADAIIE